MVLLLYKDMKYTHIIWDFNGTILNDIDTGIDAVNAVLSKYGKPTIDSVEYYRTKFCFPVIDYYDSIGLERENFDVYAPAWFHEYSIREPNAPIFDGVVDTLEYFKANGYKQYLLSATERDMLKKQTDRLGVTKYFTELIGQNTIEAHGKIGEAIAFVKRERPEKILLIGDTLHDFEVAGAINADCFLLAYGHQDKARLESTGCRVFNDITEILDTFKSGEVI